MGGHEMKYATKIFPDVMRWLWKDWPRPIKAGAGSPHHQKLLLPGEAWKAVAGHYRATTSPTANAQGEVFFCDAPADKTYKIGLDGKVGRFSGELETRGRSGLRPQGTAVCNRRRRGRGLRRPGQGQRDRRGYSRPSRRRGLAWQRLCDQPQPGGDGKRPALAHQAGRREMRRGRRI